MNTVLIRNHIYKNAGSTGIHKNLSTSCLFLFPGREEISKFSSDTDSTVEDVKHFSKYVEYSVDQFKRSILPYKDRNPLESPADVTEEATEIFNNCAEKEEALKAKTELVNKAKSDGAQLLEELRDDASKLNRLANSNKTIDGRHRRDTEVDLELNIVDGEKSIAELVEAINEGFENSNHYDGSEMSDVSDFESTTADDGEDTFQDSKNNASKESATFSDINRNNNPEPESSSKGDLNKDESSCKAESNIDESSSKPEPNQNESSESSSKGKSKEQGSIFDDLDPNLEMPDYFDLDG